MSPCFSHHSHDVQCPSHSNGMCGQRHLHSCIANAEGLFGSKSPLWWRSFSKCTLCKVAWSSRYGSSGLPHLILTASQLVRVDSRKMTIVSENKSCWHFPSVYHGNYCSYLRTSGISCCFYHWCASHSILKNISPSFTVVKCRAPTHFDCSNNDILWKHISFWFSIKFLTFIQGHMKQPQHES